MYIRVDAVRWHFLRRICHNLGLVGNVFTNISHWLVVVAILIVASVTCLLTNIFFVSFSI